MAVTIEGIQKRYEFTMEISNCHKPHGQIAEIVDVCHLYSYKLNNLPWANVPKGADATPWV